MSEVAVKFGENLKQLRQEKKLTRNQLAEKLGIAAVTIAGYETGIRTPSFEKLVEIANFFCISIDSLFEREKFFERELEKKNLEFRFKRVEKLMTLLGLSVEELEDKKIIIYSDEDFEALYEFGGIDERHEFLPENSEYFTNKKTFVEFVETMERKAIRENKIFSDVFLEGTAIKKSQY
jgi:DNA-binding XRE family transcriptional regulator